MKVTKILLGTYICMNGEGLNRERRGTGVEEE